MTDRYERIRKALAMRPTPGPWEQDIDEDGTYAMFRVRSAAEAAFIIECSPDTIRELLAERDALAAEVERLRRGAHPAITHCEKCGCDWLDNGLNPAGCPYCKQSEQAAEIERFRTDGASAVRWAPDSAYWSEILKELFGPDACAGIDILERRWRAALEQIRRDEDLLRQALKALDTQEAIAALRERLSEGANHG